MATVDGMAQNGGGRTGRAAARPTTRRIAADELDLTALFRVLLKKWLLIALITSLFVGVAGAYVTFAPKTWRATSRVLLDPRDKVVVGPSLSQPIPGVDVGWVASQASVVTSAATLGSVVRSEGLEQDPDFGGSFEDAMREFAEAVVVDRDPTSYVLAVSVTTGSAEKSARLSAALADAFVSELARTKADSARQVSELLTAQLDDLRDKARAADERLQAYRREKGLVSISGRQVDEETVRQLNDSYLAAQQRTREALSRRESLERILEGGGTQFDSNLDAVNSAVVTRLKVEFALAARAAEELAQDLGPSHPRMVAARADVERARTLILDELRSLAQTATVDYELALNNEQETRRALDEATGAVNAASIAGVELRELEADANVRRDLYLNFVQRLEQTGLQENIQIPDARVIEPAPVPIRPYWPKRTLVLALAGLAGFGIGLSAALYAGRHELLGDEDDDHDGEAPDEAAVPPIPARAPVLPPRPISVAEVSVALPGAGLFGRTPKLAAADLSAALSEESSQAALGRLLDDVAARGGRGGLYLVAGLAEPRAVAAVAYALGRLSAGRKAATLLVDASADVPRLADAVLAPDATGLVDVACRGLPSDKMDCHLETDDLTVVGLGRTDEAEVSAKAADLARFVGELGSRFDRTVVNLGERLQPALMDELAARAAGIVLVVDAASRTDKATARIVQDLSQALPGLSGLVLATMGKARKGLFGR